MEKLIVDSSVAIKWFVVEPYSIEARRVLDAYQSGTLSFFAPDLINAELGNIVWKKHLYQGLTARDAEDILTSFHQLQINITPTTELLADAYQIAVNYRQTVYDSLYLALSVRENCKCVTADEKLVNAVSQYFANLIWLATWP